MATEQDRIMAEDERQHRGPQFELRLANALDMADSEPEVIDVIERCFAAAIPGAPAELLLAENGQAPFLRLASGAGRDVPGCPVDSAEHCPAARRAQTQQFPDSEDFDACPKSRGRANGAVSALCVPVPIMGGAAGVIHTTSRPQALPAEAVVRQLETLAKLAGARIGQLRPTTDTQPPAVTDALTGLMNRGSFEHKASTMLQQVATVAIAMADLDHLTDLNDTYGQEIGDRVLRLFAQVLRESVRDNDLVCRHGRKEFVLALPGCSGDRAEEILQAVGIRLDAAITVAGLPRFTASFGVVEAGPQEGLRAALARADLALLEAKGTRRDRIVVRAATGTT